MNGISYKGQPGALIWGPTSISVAPDKSFWIADGATNRLLHYSHNGEKLDSIALGKYHVRGVGDIESTTANLWIFDIAALEPSLHRLSLEGELQASYTIPFGRGFEEALMGIALGGQGEVLIEGVNQAGEFVAQLVNAEGEFAPQYLTGYPHHGTIYTTELPDGYWGERTYGYVAIGEQSIKISTARPLVGLQILAVNSDQSFYVRVYGLGGGDVNTSIHHYSRAGTLLGVTHLSYEMQYVSVMHDITVALDGAVYRLLTHVDYIEIVQLQFVCDTVSTPMPTQSNERK